MKYLPAIIEVVAATGGSNLQSGWTFPLTSDDKYKTI